MPFDAAKLVRKQGLAANGANVMSQIMEPMAQIRAHEAAAEDDAGRFRRRH
jgi:hypothetical protein